MALVQADTLKPWVTPQLRPFDPGVLSDLAKLGLTQKRMRQDELDKMKPDLTAYGVDKLKGLAGDVSIVSRQANRTVNAYNQLIRAYGGDIDKAHQSQEYQEIIEPALSKVLYNKNILDENYAKYQLAKNIAPQELQEYYLDDSGKPKIIEGKGGEKHFLTKEEYINLEFQRTDPTKFQFSKKLDDDNLLQPVDFNIRKGSMQNFNDEMKAVYGATGSSDLTGVQWDNLTNLDPEVRASLGALLSFAPYSNTNAQQISSAVDAFLSGGVSPESRHGLEQAYWRKIEEQGMKMKDDNDTFQKFAYDQIKKTAKIYIDEKLSVPKGGSGSGSGEDKTKFDYFTSSEYGINYSQPYVDRIVYQGTDDNGNPIEYEAPVGTAKHRAPDSAAAEAYPKGKALNSLGNVFYFNGKMNMSGNLKTGGYVARYLETNYKPYVFDPAIKDYRLPNTEQEAIDALNGVNTNAAGQQVQGAPRVMPFDKLVVVVHEEDLDDVIEAYKGFDYTTAPVNGQNKRILSTGHFRSDNYLWGAIGGVEKEARDAGVVLNDYTKSNAEAVIGQKLPAGPGTGDRYFEIVVEVPRNPNLIFKDSMEARSDFMTNKLQYLGAIRDQMLGALQPISPQMRSIASMGSVQ